MGVHFNDVVTLLCPHKIWNETRLSHLVIGIHTVGYKIFVQQVIANVYVKPSPTTPASRWLRLLVVISFFIHCILLQPLCVGILCLVFVLLCRTKLQSSACEGTSEVLFLLNSLQTSDKMFSIA